VCTKPVPSARIFLAGAPPCSWLDVPSRVGHRFLPPFPSRTLVTPLYPPLFPFPPDITGAISNEGLFRCAGSFLPWQESPLIRVNNPSRPMGPSLRAFPPPGQVISPGAQDFGASPPCFIRKLNPGFTPGLFFFRDVFTGMQTPARFFFSPSGGVPVHRKACAISPRPLKLSTPLRRLSISDWLGTNPIGFQSQTSSSRLLQFFPLCSRFCKRPSGLMSLFPRGCCARFDF